MDEIIDQSSRTSPEERLSVLRDAWIAARNARSAAYRALLDAHKLTPEAKAYSAARRAEKRAKTAFARALQKQEKEHDRGIDTRPEAADRS